MKIAYLILAHNNPEHLRRLVGAVTSPSSVCFIHIDKKSTIADFLPMGSEIVVLSDKRLGVYWGDFSMVEATLVLIRKALADPRHFDRLVLLSGTDYPLRSVSTIESFLVVTHRTNSSTLCKCRPKRKESPFTDLPTSAPALIRHCQ